MSMAPLYKLTRNPALLYIIAVLAFVGIFEFLPAIENAQAYVSPENYENPNAFCQTLLNDRPWYGRLNHWFVAWIIFTPVFIFLFPPRLVAWKRGVRTVLAVVICYMLMNLAVHLQWDIRNAPFGQGPFHSISENGWRMDCVNIGDGFSLVFALMLGWIPACAYTGISLCFWHFYHRKIAKKMTPDYKSDIVTRILFLGLIAYSIVTSIFLMALVAHKAGLFDIKPIALLYYFTLRPLMIPFEIFVY